MYPICRLHLFLILFNIGVNCESEIAECASSPCENNATCIELLNKYRCNCFEGFTGMNIYIKDTQ